MRKSLSVTMPEFAVGKEDVKFRVRTGKGVLGELQISKGSLVWFPPKAKRGRKVIWEQFVRFAEENGVPAEAR